MTDFTRDVIFLFRSRQSRIAYSSSKEGKGARASLLTNPIERRVMDSFSRHWIQEKGQACDYEKVIHIIYLALVTPKYFRQRVLALSNDIKRLPGLQYVPIALRPRITPLVAQGCYAEAWRIICDAENPAWTATKIRAVLRRVEAEKISLHQNRVVAFHAACAEKSAKASPEGDPEDASLEVEEAQLLSTGVW